MTSAMEVMTLWLSSFLGWVWGMLPCLSLLTSVKEGLSSKAHGSLRRERVSLFINGCTGPPSCCNVYEAYICWHLETEKVRKNDFFLLPGSLHPTVHCLPIILGRIWMSLIFRGSLHGDKISKIGTHPGNHARLWKSVFSDRWCAWWVSCRWENWLCVCSGVFSTTPLSILHLLHGCPVTITASIASRLLGWAGSVFLCNPCKGCRIESAHVGNKCSTVSPHILTCISPMWWKSTEGLNKFWEWRDGRAVKSVCCSLRGPEFYSQPPCCGLIRTVCNANSRGSRYVWPP